MFQAIVFLSGAVDNRISLRQAKPSFPPKPAFHSLLLDFGSRAWFWSRK